MTRHCRAAPKARDAAIHTFAKKMDARVKPAHDEADGTTRSEREAH
jgi:hypothetical protein